MQRSSQQTRFTRRRTATAVSAFALVLFSVWSSVDVRPVNGFLSSLSSTMTCQMTSSCSPPLPASWPVRRDTAPLFVMHQIFSSSSHESASRSEHDDEAMTSVPKIAVYNTQQVVETLKKFRHMLRKSNNDTRTAWRLSRYLQDYPVLLLEEDVDDNDEESSLTTTQLVQSMEAVMIPALRVAGDNNDYRLILQLVSSSIAFANQHGILTSRVFGEAVHALSATQANASKLKSIWKLAVACSEKDGTFPAAYRSEPLTAFELNLYLKALASRGKSKACVDVFQRHIAGEEEDNDKMTAMKIVPDSYTISSLFSILTESINSSEQKACDPVDFSLSNEESTSSSDLFRKLASLTTSTCWQWNAAVEILGTLQRHVKNTTAITYTNHVYSTLLKLQVRAQKEFVDHRNGSQLTVAILEDMMQRNVMPDIVTCTLAIMAMGQMDKTKSHTSNDKEDKRTNLAVDFLRRMKSDARLPAPNRYSYSAAIMACARQKDHQMALFLLEEMRAMSKNDTSLHPNTLCYNQVLLSLDDAKELVKKSFDWVTRKRKRQSAKDQQMEQRHRTGLALSLLDQMKGDFAQFQHDTKPDVVTFNTILSIGHFPYQGNNQSDAITALSLLDAMTSNNISRDAVSYRNAILAASESDETLSILQKCIGDDYFMRTTKRNKGGKKEVTAVFNAGLSRIASCGDYTIFRDVVSIMAERQIPMDNDSLTATIELVGKSGDGTLLMAVIEILDRSARKVSPSTRGFSAFKSMKSDNKDVGDDDDASNFIQFLSVFSFPTLQDFHFTRAIETCLKVGDFTNAYNILKVMRERGLQPSTRCMEGFATAYANAATNTAKEITEISISRAESAYMIAMALKQPRASTLGIVARACAITGQWKQARSLMRLIHGNILKVSDAPRFSTLERELSSVKKTHTILLRECATQGNLNAAMFYTSDIQDFSNNYRIALKNDQQFKFSLEDVSEIFLEDQSEIFLNLGDLTESTPSNSNPGMRAQDWTLLIQAASKAGNWRVCFNSLQFLEPYVARAKQQNTSVKKVDSVDQKYEQLAPALTAVTRCLESHGQDAWASRSIKDWIKWSGRKPRAEAVLSAIRVLASKGQGEEVKGLIENCLQKTLGCCSTKKGVGYEEMILIGAVTSLHQNGLYDDADDIYMSGISSGIMPFNFASDTKGQHLLDLHGLNIALSHSAVRIAMRQHAAKFDDRTDVSDMIIVTGRGRNSALHLRPILRPEIQRMLMEEFYPPLNSLSVAGNIGALQVLGQDIQAWQQHQEEQKGARMLELASLLRNISNQDRLKKSIFASIRAIERDRIDNETK